MSDTDALRLMADTSEDLRVVSAVVQDAVARSGDLRYDARRRRFTLELNRFRWEAADRQKKGGERVRCILGFDGVLAVKSRGVSKADPDMIVAVLSLDFEAGEEAPTGVVRITFAGDGEVVLDVECLDSMLVDTDAVWATRNRPDHDRTIS